MSQPHLSHLIPWSALVHGLQRPDPSSISLPIGECGFIHIDKKSTKIKIDNRNYIPDQTCNGNCKIVEEKSFSKNKKKEIVILPKSRSISKDEDIKKNINYFAEKFFNAILKFGETEEKKYLNINSTDITDNIINDLLLDVPFHIKDISRNNDYVIALTLECDFKNLLILNDKKQINILEAFCLNYGGQAVGQGFKFLFIYHLLPFYLTANAIIACGFQDDPSKWGLLSPERHFYDTLLYDCDFFTFIPKLRPYLSKDIFMIDLEKTNVLLKACFQYIYLFFWFSLKVNYYGNKDLFEEIQWEIARCFSLHNTFQLWN